MQVGDLVKANNTPKARRLSFPQCFGVITKTYGDSKIVYVYWLDGIHNGERPIHQCYLEVLCK